MSKRTLLALAAAAVVVAGALVLLLRDDRAPAATDQARDAGAAQPAPRRLASADPGEASSGGGQSLPSISLDDDPPGPLRLEGLVLDENELPVAGAVVHLGSSPPRETETGEDGTFVFDELVGKRYALYARTEDRVGGPVMHLLSSTSDPVVIRVRAGAGVEVSVIDAATGEPIAGAQVGLVTSDAVRAQTDAEGVALLPNVPAGQHTLFATAPGYAEARQVAGVPETAGVTVRRQIALEPGVILIGRVVDPEGEPVEGARVIARPAGAFFDFFDARRDGVATDADGRFSLPNAPTGTVRLSAVHREFSPTTTEAIELSPGTEPEPVEIVLDPGAAVAGVVVTAKGAPAAWATVRVGPDPEIGGWRLEGAHRQVVAGEDGRFEITGLRRSRLVVSAQSDAASSQIAAVDLRQGSADDLTLRLDLEGAIAGVVVDENGEPVAEAQVMALPDFWEGGDMKALVTRGPSYATTDGGGRFTIGGLPDTRYRVRASRTPLSMRSGMNDKGVAAKVGDRDLRIVLATPGAIAGKVQLSDGSAPELATVSIGWDTGVPVQGGTFRVENLAPGTYDVTVRGLGFPDRVVSAVEVEAGDTTDVGTVTLRRGRAVSGRVLDPSGAPVAGATVVIGKQLLGDGDGLTADGLGSMLDEQMGIRRTTSGEDGSFRLSGLGKSEQALAAEHPERGRSLAQTVPAGDGDLTFDLTLAPFGSLHGTVTVDGAPRGGVGVIVAPTTGATQMVAVETDDSGAFTVARLAAGDYKVSAMSGAMGSASMAADTVTVPPGGDAEVTLAITEGNITFEVAIEGEGGAKIDAAQVFLFEGRAAPRNGGELNDIFLSGDSSAAKMGFAFGTAPATFQKVSPATYSVCVIPINGDMNDPVFAQRLQRHVETLAVHCRQARVDESPTTQRFTAVVPPMQPLPED